jgi:SSS family solute:Na+ symporter
MLLWLVIAYLAVSIGIGLAAALRVHNARDYIVAGRNLPIYIVTAMVFATWFGAETVLGISATFLEEGLLGLVSDPLGAALCLILFGLFFAARLYRLNMLTLGDFFRLRYNRSTELVLSACIVMSYLGWVSAQITALGLVFNVVSEGSISQELGMIIGAAVVLTYTLFGGMWSVAVTTFVQMIIIVLGLVYIAWLVADMAGGVPAVVSHASEAGKLNPWPELTLAGVVGWIGALLTLAFGSIPQQDVFQRANSAHSERIAVRGSVYGGIAYFLFAAIPLFLAYAAFLIDPAMVDRFMAEDAQLILPTLILNDLPFTAQVIFFGALLSVIMSTASGTLLAPSVTFSENIVKGFFPHMSDSAFLWLTRATVVLFAGAVLAYSLASDSSIHQMVEDAYKVTLAAAFVPLAAGLYWSRANGLGAALSIVLGIVVWRVLEVLAPEAAVPPHLGGFVASAIGMLVGGFAGPRPAADYDALLILARGRAAQKSE